MSIKYIGPDLFDNKGKKRLIFENIYKLSCHWDGRNINGYWIFYLFDETDTNCGYELDTKYVTPIREINLNVLLGKDYICTI